MNTDSHNPETRKKIKKWKHWIVCCRNRKWMVQIQQTIGVIAIHKLWRVEYYQNKLDTHILKDKQGQIQEQYVALVFDQKGCVSHGQQQIVC